MAKPYRRPTMMVDGKQQLVSRVTMSRHLGRELGSDEIVHHINEDPFDNRVENLQLVTRAEHKRLHGNIGTATRLKKQWELDEAEVLRRFKHEPIAAIAGSLGCSESTVRRVVKKSFGSVDLRSIRPQLHPHTYQKESR